MLVPRLDTELAALREQGFVVARGFAPRQEWEALHALSRQQLADTIAPLEYEADVKYPGAPPSRDAQGGLTARRLLDAYSRHPLYQQWATSARIREWLARYFNDVPVLSRVHHNCVMTKHPDFGSQTGWHQDIRYWSFSCSDLVSCWLALGQENRHNGGLWFVPGSHSAAFSSQQFDEQKFFRPDAPENAAWLARAVCPDLEAGDVVFFHCRTLHAARRNASAQVKLSLVHTYHAQSCPPVAGTRSASLPGVSLTG